MRDLALEQLHGDEAPPVVRDALLEDPDNVGVPELLEYLKLTLEALNRAAADVEPLEGEVPVCGRTHDLKDLSGATSRDDSDDRVLADALSAQVDRSL